jgi:predicted phosphodiesterase
VLTDDGKYIDYTSGNVVPSQNYVLSTLIPVCKGDVIHYDLSGPSGVALVTAFRYDGTQYGTLVNGTSASHTSGSVTCNGKYAFIKIGNRKTYPGRSFYINQSCALPQGAKTYIDQSRKDLVPFYWESNIASAITRYYAKNVLVGRSGVSFIFITDTHTVDNFCKSPALINYLYENTNIVNIVHGGDFIRNGQAESLEFENKFLSYLELLPVLGNHDVDSSVSADDENAYAYIFRRYENRYVDRDGFSYCFDIESQKMRFIMLDYRYNSSVTYLENHVKEGYKHIIFNHCYWWSYNSSTQEYTVSEVAQAIAEKADDLKSGGYDICAMIVGHIHQDKDTVTSGGIPIIATNCDAAGQSAGNGGRTMEGNTDSEQCFDIVNVDYVNSKLYFTRVGAGGSDADRTFDY